MGSSKPPTMAQGSSNALTQPVALPRCPWLTWSSCIVPPAVRSPAGVTRRVWGLGHAIRPLMDPHWIWRCTCVNTRVCWTRYLLGRDWKRQQYELIYLCNLLWLSLFLIPNTPHNFQERPRLTAFWEDTSLWHKNVFARSFSKTLFSHFDCRANVQQHTFLVANKKKTCTREKERGERFPLWSNGGGGELIYEFQGEKWLVAWWLCQDNTPGSISPWLSSAELSSNRALLTTLSHKRCLVSNCTYMTLQAWWMLRFPNEMWYLANAKDSLNHITPHAHPTDLKFGAFHD